MKYKQLMLQQQKEIIKYKLLYTLSKILHKKQIAAEAIIEKKEPEATQQPIIGGNRKTEIHIRSFYKDKEGLIKGFDIASKIAQAGIVDEVNIDVPMEWMTN